MLCLCCKTSKSFFCHLSPFRHPNNHYHVLVIISYKLCTAGCLFSFHHTITQSHVCGLSPYLRVCHIFRGFSVAFVAKFSSGRTIGGALGRSKLESKCTWEKLGLGVDQYLVTRKISTSTKRSLAVGDTFAGRWCVAACTRKAFSTRVIWLCHLYCSSSQ